MLILAILTAATYYAAHKWIKLEHNSYVLADEHKRAVSYIEELEARIAMLEAERSLHEFKARPQEETTGWESFNVRR
jgi:primase-polymerase (primpol)-like protein